MPDIDTTTHFQRVKNLIKKLTITTHTNEPLTRMTGHTPSGIIATIGFKSIAQAKGYAKYSGARTPTGDELTWNEQPNGTLEATPIHWQNTTQN